MFGKLKQILSGSSKHSVELDIIRNYLGQKFAEDFQNLVNGVYKDNEALAKRANGLSYLAKAILATKQGMKDEDRHRHFWQDIALPSISPPFELSFMGKYDPAKFYIDAVDYSLSISTLLTLLENGKTPPSIKLVDTIAALNLRESSKGGYFGNTPYWKMQKNPLWRAIDRQFTSVQVYWFALLLSDLTSAGMYETIVKAALSRASLDGYENHEEIERRLFSGEILHVTEYLSLSALQISALKNLSNSRSKALFELTSFYADEGVLVANTLLTCEAMDVMKTLHSFVDQNHVLMELPDSVFSLNAEVYSSLADLITLIQITDNIQQFPNDTEVITNPRQTAPHLLHASM